MHNNKENVISNKEINQYNIEDKAKKEKENSNELKNNELNDINQKKNTNIKSSKHVQGMKGKKDCFIY